jgi:hypothetical protein
MTQFSPVTGSIIQSQQVQRQQPADKAKQIERAQKLVKNSAVHQDHFEHQVESAEELDPAHDDDQSNGGQQRHKQQRKKPATTEQAENGEQPPRLDIVA